MKKSSKKKLVIIYQQHVHTHTVEIEKSTLLIIKMCTKTP